MLFLPLNLPITSRSGKLGLSLPRGETTTFQSAYRRTWRDLDTCIRYQAFGKINVRCATGIEIRNLFGQPEASLRPVFFGF